MTALQIIGLFTVALAIPGIRATDYTLVVRMGPSESSWMVPGTVNPND